MNFILLRGLIRHAEHWGAFSEQLQQRFPESKILTPDLPGLGQESHVLTPLTIEENVAFLSAKLSSDLAEGEWVIVGLSLGGMVAAEWCAAAPKTFRKVILINPSSNLSPFWHRLRPEALPVFLRCFITSDDALREERILALTSNLKNEDESLIQSWIKISETGAIRRVSFLRQLAAARAFKIQHFDTPCTILTSKKDRIVNPLCSSQIAAYLGTHLETHHEAGHDLAIDAPEWVLNHTKRFVA